METETLRASIQAAGETHGWFRVTTENTDVFRLPESRMYVAVAYGSEGVSWATTPTRYLMGEDKASRVLGILTKESPVRQ